MRILSIAGSCASLAAATFGMAGVLLAGTNEPGDTSAAVPPASGPALAPAPAPAASDFRVFWRDGLRMESADKAFSMSVIGRIHNDWVWHSADDEIEEQWGEFVDGTRFRRARLGVEGRMHEHILYKAEFDFAGGNAGFRDVFIGTSRFDFANIRAGHLKEPFGLEQLTSSNNITFVERSLPDTFTPGFNTGLGLNQTFADSRGTWGMGVFRTVNGFGDDWVDTTPTTPPTSDGGYAATGRVTFLPLYRDGGEQLVHLGLAATYRDLRGDTTRYRQRPENSFAPRIVDTGNFAAEDVLHLGAEAAWVQGPVSVQGEYMIADVSSDAADDPRFHGWYAMVSWILTGERRGYRTSGGHFDRVRPERNFGTDGWGAWELALRYSSIDLSDGPVQGGELDNITAGVNWYWNPNVRMMLNYVHSDAESPTAEGNADAVLLRFQIAF